MSAPKIVKVNLTPSRVSRSQYACPTQPPPPLQRASVGKFCSRGVLHHTERAHSAEYPLSSGGPCVHKLHEYRRYANT